MANDDWFRNKSWDSQIAAAFELKLKRARRKSQYLRIQGSYLAPSHPTVALELLDRYFEQGDEFDHAQAHVDRAAAFLALGQLENAYRSYESALEREAVFPNLRTCAYLELPYQIALHGSAHRYSQAMELLASGSSRLMFAADHFAFHATKAIILGAEGDIQGARAEARPALEAAGLDHSGLRYHPTVGLVSERHAQALQLLRLWCDA